MSKSYQIIYTPESLNDLRDIHAYIAYRLHEPNTARRLLQRIRDEIRSLKEMPEQCRLVDLGAMAFHRHPLSPGWKIPRLLRS